MFDLARLSLFPSFLLTNLSQHTLFFGRANLDLTVTDKGSGALLGIQYSQFRIGLANRVGGFTCKCTANSRTVGNCSPGMSRSEATP